MNPGTAAAATGRMADYPDYLAALVDDYLKALEFGEVAQASPLVEAMNYSLLAGGKRIRPVLCLAAGSAFGSPADALLPTAAALEMVHTYSLIHDDLPSFDDDDLRRGQPTCHVKYGENIAILAGDALFAEAFRLICERQAGPPEMIRAVMAGIAEAAGVRGMVGGQFLDVSDVPGEAEQNVRLLHQMKTGRLIEASVDCGSLLAGIAEEDRAGLKLFARELGLLFQIKDDILDVVGETSVLGKVAGADARLERLTYVSVHGLDEAEQLAEKSRDQALAALDGVSGDTGALASITHYIYERRK